MSSPALKCVEYSKKHFKEFLDTPSYIEQIRKLLTLLIYKDDLDKSPYPEFKVDTLWVKIINLFISECCSILRRILK